MTAARTDWAWVVVAALLSLAAPAQAAGVYKWVDAQGQVHYDDTNLLSLRLTQIDMDRRRIDARPTVRTPRAFDDQVQQRCAVSRERLANYREARALYGQDPAGNVYLLSPRQTGIEVAESERDTALYCSAGAADRLYAEQLASWRKAGAAASGTGR